LSGLWGKLACNILLHQWDYGVEDFDKLKNFIDEDAFRSSLQVIISKNLEVIACKTGKHNYKMNILVFATKNLASPLGSLPLLQPYQGLGPLARPPIEQSQVFERHPNHMSPYHAVLGHCCHHQ
jgi:hypothetical protein